MYNLQAYQSPQENGMLLRSEDDGGDDGLIRKTNVKVRERSECVNYWVFDFEHHLNVTRSTVSIRNTLFCHFPVTMVTDCEMCFLCMY